MSDLVTTTGSIVTKGAFTRILALKGIPGEIVDIVASTVSKALNANDAAAKAEFEQIKEDMLFELAAQQEKYNDKRPPSAEDVHAGLVRFVQTFQNAGNHKKRRVLFNAFYNSFQPGFYDEGVSKILWDKVERLEYPDFFFLHRVLRAFYPNSWDDSLPNFRVEEHPPIRVLDTDVAQIELHLPHAEFAERLAREGLLRIQEDGPKHARLRLRGFASEMRDFALREAWRAESTENIGSRSTESGSA